MSSIPKGQRHPAELRERAVRMVLHHTHEYASPCKAIESIAEKLGIHRETLRVWVRRPRSTPAAGPASPAMSESDEAIAEDHGGSRMAIANHISVIYAVIH